MKQSQPLACRILETRNHDDLAECRYMKDHDDLAGYIYMKDHDDLAEYRCYEGSRRSGWIQMTLCSEYLGTEHHLVQSNYFHALDRQSDHAIEHW